MQMLANVLIKYLQEMNKPEKQATDAIGKQLKYPPIAMYSTLPCLNHPMFLRGCSQMMSCAEGTAVRLVYNPFSQFGPQLELYSQLQLSLWSDPIALGVPNST